MTNPLQSRHSKMTRLLHLTVALAVIWQLLTSLVMREPHGEKPGNAIFETHEWVGIFTLCILMVYWIYVLVRRVGTDRMAMMPWFSAPHRAALVQDLRRHWDDLRRFRRPKYVEGSALIAAAEGLGLLLISLMAFTGFCWWLNLPAGIGWLAIETHELFSNLVWAYLIGHGAMAVLHHVTRDASLAQMWPLR